MYGIMATKKGTAYFNVLTTPFPATATINTTGANRMASTNNTTKMLFNILVRTAIHSLSDAVCNNVLAVAERPACPARAPRTDHAVVGQSYT